MSDQKAEYVAPGDDYPEPMYHAKCLNCGREDEVDGPAYGPYFCSRECSKAGTEAIESATFD